MPYSKVVVVQILFISIALCPQLNGRRVSLLGVRSLLLNDCELITSP